MNPTWQDHLSARGVDASVVEELSNASTSPPLGSVAVVELAGARGAQQAVLVALIAAAHYSTCASALGPLLDLVSADLEAIPTFDQARYWHLRGVVALRREGDLYTATRSLNRSLDLLDLKSIGDHAYSARVHDTMGQVLARQGLLNEAKDEYMLSLSRRMATGDDIGAAITLGNLGRLCLQLGDYVSARDYLTDDIRLVTKLSPEREPLLAQLHTHRAEAALELADGQSAREDLSAALRLAGMDVRAIAFAAVGVGRVELADGNLEASHAWLAQARDLVSETGRIAPCNDLRAAIHRLEGDLALAAGNVEQALAEYQLACELLSLLDDPVDYAKALCGLARVHLARGEQAVAATKLREALRALDATAADGLRGEVEQTLRASAPDAWLLHAAARFIGQEQIDRAIEDAGRPGFRGDSLYLCTLFADIRGFTALSERLEPERLITHLNSVLGQMTRCIESVGGTVDKFIGDAAMALFSVPDPEPARDVERAIQSALFMEAELNRFNRGNSEGLPPLSVGVGMHCGDVVAGLVGSPQKRSFTVIGDSVNTASRVEGMTKVLGAKILITDVVLSHLRQPERFVLRPLGRFSPKGRASSVGVFEVLGEHSDGIRGELAAELEELETAHARFLARDFATAANLYMSLAERFRLHAPGYELLAGASRELLAAPPAAEWQGEIVLTAK